MNEEMIEASRSDVSDPLQAAYLSVHCAVCAEAVRVIFALHALARSGIDQLTAELQRCQYSEDGASRIPHSIYGTTATSPDSDVSTRLIERHQQHPFGWQSRDVSFATSALVSSSADQGSADTYSFPKRLFGGSSTAARCCIEQTSLMGLLTAVHLLRCSAWTAYTLTGVESTDAATATLNEARALEKLRTCEPGWCATALVRFSEWLLRHDASSRTRGLLAHALLLKEYDCVQPTSANTTTRVEPLLPYARQLWVEDRLTRYLSLFVMRSDDLSGCRSDGVRDSSTAAPPCCSGCCGCDHRWFLEDLPRWCVRAASDKEAVLRWRQHLLRRTFVHWRTRRGLRMMTYLSHAAANGKDDVVGTDDVAKADDSASIATEEYNDEDAREALGQLGRRYTVECQTSAMQSRTYNVAEAEPAETGEAEAPAAVSRRPAKSETPPSLVAPAARVACSADENKEENEVLKCVAAVQREASSTTGPASLREVSLLDRVLQVNSSVAEVGTSASAFEERRQHDPKNDASTTHASTTGEDLPLRSAKLRGAAAALMPPSPELPDLSLVGTDPQLSAEEADNNKRIAEEREAELLLHFRRQHNRVVLRSTFLHWRNRRLYEAMATHYLVSQHAEALTRRCWGQWQRRYSAALRRRKMARDEALGDMVTEQKAVQYFRTILQVWRRAALARRALLRTVGRRVLQSWRCRASLVRFQRDSGQTFVGAHRLKVAVWQRWRDRMMEERADAHSALRLTTAAFARMQLRCREHAALRIASAHYARWCVAHMWRTWQTRYAGRLQLSRTTAQLSSREPRLRSQAWRRWQYRFQQRETQRSHAAQAARFHSMQVFRRCVSMWWDRYEVESRVRTFASRNARLTLLQPAFERWRSRTEVCVVVRRDQEELAWRVGDQLQCRKVLRVWRRRASAHAAQRRAVRAANIEAEADAHVQLNRLARTFFHWRTRSLVLRRYGADARRRLSAVPLKDVALPLSPASPALLDDKRTRPAASDSMAKGRVSLRRHAASAAPLPRQMSSSSTTSRNPSARVSPRAARAPHTTPRGRKQVIASLLDGITAARSEASDEGYREDAALRCARRIAHQTPPPPCSAPVAAAVKPTALVVRISTTTPPRRRALRLERQLFAAQEHTALSSFGVCPPRAPTSTSSSVAPTALPLAKPEIDNAAFNPKAAQRRTATHAASQYTPQHQHSRDQQTRQTHMSWPVRMPTSSRDHSARSSGSSSRCSDAENQLPIRSKTATPLFTRDATLAHSPELQQRTAVAMSDLVESPPQFTPRPAKNSRGEVPQPDATAFTRASSSSARLLGRMEQLLQRVRGSEADYQNPPKPLSNVVKS